jgi:tetratricopeptide (TPR) repeat protein
VAAYRLALALEPGHREAQRELAALAPPPARTDPAIALREEARNHFRARRFGPAAEAYRRITQLHGDDAAAFAGLGASLLAGRDAAGAVSAYRRATQLDPSSAGFWAALGAAEEAARNTQGAIGAYRRALSLDASLRAPRQALGRLDPAPSRPSGLPTAVAVRPEPAPPPPPSGPSLPDTPSRDDIVRALSPFQPRLEACAPSISGTVLFRIVIEGERGNVREVEVSAAYAGTDEAGCMESHLMGARFPRFARSELEIRYPFQLEGEPVPEDAPPVDP